MKGKGKKKILTVKKDNRVGRKKVLGSFCFKQKKMNSMRTKTKDGRPSDPRNYIRRYVSKRSENTCLHKKLHTYTDNNIIQNNQNVEQPGWLSGLAPPLAQGVVLETPDLVPCQAPCMEWSLLLSLPVSVPLSLSVSL